MFGIFTLLRVGVAAANASSRSQSTSVPYGRFDDVPRRSNGGRAAAGCIGGLIFVGAVIGLAVYFTHRIHSSYTDDSTSYNQDYLPDVNDDDLNPPDLNYPYYTTAKPVKYNPYPGRSPTSDYRRPSGTPEYAWNMSRMMSTTHPCKDFYQYACGRWLRDNPAEGYRSHSAIGSMDDEVKEELAGLLNQSPTSQDSQAVTKAKMLYKSCLNTASISRRGATPLQNLLDRVGLDRDYGNQAKLVDKLIQVAKYRSFPLGILQVMTDPKHASKTVIVLDQPNLSMRSLTAGDPEYTGFQNFIDKVVENLNYHQYRLGDSVVEDVDSLISFQRRLTELTTDDDDRPPIEARYHRYTLGSLNSQFPAFDWKGYIKGVFYEQNVTKTLSDDEPVIVYAPDYFRRVGAFIQRSTKSSVYDFIYWELVRGFLPYLSEPFRTAKDELFKALGVTMRTLPRWKTCTPVVDATMSNATGRLYIDHEFEPEALEVTTSMVKDIRKVFKERMQSDSWMDSQTKSRAIEKLDAIGELIGYPPEILNNTLLDQQYEDLTITGQYFENIVAIVTRTTANNLKTLHQPSLRLQWETGPTTVNAFYKAENNVIVVPAGILRKPFFSREYPKSVIYASLGLVVAHEMTHGFDNKGRKYAKDGSLLEWWSQSALRSYRQKEKCYVKQYSSYTIDDITNDYVRLNGTKTLGENIADNGGIRDAFKAYTEWVNRQTGTVPAVPYLELTHNQVFYLAFAQRWCESRGSDSAQLASYSDVHSPGALRVKGTLQNSNHFAQTFNCAAGTPMNPPRQKCRIW